MDNPDHKRLEAYFQTEVVGILESGADGTIARANRGICQMLGFQPEEMVGKTWAELTHPDDIEISKFYHDQCTKGVMDICQFEKRYIDKNGDSVPVLMSIQAGERDANGVPQWYVAFVATLTEVHQIRKALSDLVVKQALTYGQGVRALTRAVEARDPYTAGHQESVANLALKIGKNLNLGEDRLQGIYLGAVVHDVGKIGVPAEFLTKPTKLADLEWAYIKNHAEMGYDILKHVESPWPIAEIARQHHERLDGTGYPHGLKSNQILLEAQIVAVADTVDSMLKPRPYRSAIGQDVAVSTLVKEAGSQLNGDVVKSCLGILDSGE